MSWYEIAVVAIVSYLLGSINFSIIISRNTMKKDIREMGSGNAGSTNAFRTMGKKRAVMVVIGDSLKCAVAVLVSGLLFGPLGKLIAGMAVMLGHIFPIYFEFRGGKGALTAAIMVLCLDFRIFCIVMAVFFVIVLTTRYVSLASICATASFPILMHIFYNNALFTILSIVMSSIIIFMHRTNIVRLINKTESKFSIKKDD